MQVQLKNVRLSYANIWEPTAPANEPDAPKKYSVALLFEKGGDVDKTIKRTIKETMEENGKVLGKNPMKNPKVDKGLRNGDEKFLDSDDPDSGIMNGYEGMSYINAKANAGRPPAIVDGARRPITNESKVYSGCYCNVIIETYAYDNRGNKGVGFGLLGIQFVSDGEPLGSTFNVDAFDTFDVGDEDNDTGWDDTDDSDKVDDDTDEWD